MLVSKTRSSTSIIRDELYEFINSTIVHFLQEINCTLNKNKKFAIQFHYFLKTRVDKQFQKIKTNKKRITNKKRRKVFKSNFPNYSNLQTKRIKKKKTFFFNFLEIRLQ